MQVGSWLYMAPEMVNGHKYTEKVDVFAIAVMFFEALRGRLNILHIALDGDPAAVAEYADKVSKGHREPLPTNWPASVKSLISDGWHQVTPSTVYSRSFAVRGYLLLCNLEATRVHYSPFGCDLQHRRSLSHSQLGKSQQRSNTNSQAHAEKHSSQHNPRRKQRLVDFKQNRAGSIDSDRRV